MTMSDPNTRVEVTAIRWLIRPRSRDGIYLAAVAWTMNDHPCTYTGEAMAGPSDVQILHLRFGDESVNEFIRSEIASTVRAEVDRMCPPYGPTNG
jgi:hypothetical protein